MPGELGAGKHSARHLRVSDLEYVAGIVAKKRILFVTKMLNVVVGIARQAIITHGKFPKVSILMSYAGAPISIC